MANTPLHGGHCPPWLFEKMKQLGSVMIEVIAIEYGPTEVLRRLSDPIWFQAFGSVLGFDWHSSGLTTVLCGALKEGLHDQQGELGLFVTGGKGKASRKTPDEIFQAGEKHGLSNDLVSLQRTSRMVAKVDSAAVQDGYQLYHHFFVFDRDGNWTVVQQGMNEKNRYARRYHWLSESVKSYVEDPHQGICGQPAKDVLNLVSRNNEATRLASVELCREERPETVVKVLESIKKSNSRSMEPQQLSLFDEEFVSGESEIPDTLGSSSTSSEIYSSMTMPRPHPIPSSRHLNKILHQLYERPLDNYENLLETPGVGPSTLRALAMVAEITHGTRPSFEDPVRYAFAHGGKDKIPFPVSRRDMEHSFGVLRTAVEKAKLGHQEKLEALRRLAQHET
ncbi:DUF763 domain-containing protein [Ammoniphilus resinae]|uniref:DUF763 domain-containing protein n=1 Tax=Ammoniphilus resinae TaxID=861532 RepID=UPI003CC9126E